MAPRFLCHTGVRGLWLLSTEEAEERGVDGKALVRRRRQATDRTDARVWDLLKTANSSYLCFSILPVDTKCSLQRRRRPCVHWLEWP